MERKLQELLDRTGVKYQLIEHSPTYTALDTAVATHVDGKELAKSVIVSIDGVLTMVVVPATHWVDLDQLQVITGADLVALANEHEFTERFAGCQPGAMPPFGNLYGIPTYCASELRDDTEIVFNAGSHTEAVKMSFANFERLAKPIIDHVSRQREAIIS